MPQHFLFLSWFPWGQLSTDLGLSVTLVRKFPELVISFITEVPFVSKCRKELDRLCVDDVERTTLLPRIRLIALGNDPRPDVPFDDPMAVDMREVTVIPLVVQEQMLAKLPLFIADEKVVDDAGTEWEPVGKKPSLVLVDYGQARVAVELKKRFGIPLMLWFPEAGFAYTRFFGPFDKGGKARGYDEEVEAIYANDELRAGRSFNEIGRDCWHRSTRTTNDLVNIRGIPPYYWYEDSPHDIFVGYIWDLLRGMVDLHENVDGVLLNAVPEIVRPFQPTKVNPAKTVR
ncbi:glycosyltransferase family 1 protein [Calocera viscosa TUFC12733]|uniref:Glycosyltransferase family 1 protein n=1 Tax=Calocera viscosa (strain TUFC12733) TaxID=1330018 RepID=A0A167GNW0_CALVF|nr:glycosyltransferase family 1 protein [Calocera viscosa TUFC12733]